MPNLTDTQRHQIRNVTDRVFAFGEAGRELGRYLQAELGKGDEGHYPEVRDEILDLIKESFDRHYLAPAPRMSGR